MNSTAATRQSGAEMELGGRQGRRRLIEIAVFVALLAGAIAALPGLGEVRERLAGADPLLVGLVAAVELGSCLAFVVTFRAVFSRRLSWGFSYRVAMSEQAANVLLPTGGAGGLALGAWALGRVGMPAERIGRRTVAFFLITSSVNFAAVVLAGLGLATGVLPGDVALATALVPALLAASLLTAVALAPRVLDGPATRTADGSVRRALAAGRAHLAGGIRDAVRLIGSGRPALIGGAVAYMALDVAALALAFAALGGEAPALGGFLLAYTLGQLGGIVPLPGGIGGTDGGLIVAFGLIGTPVAVAGAAVIAYRAFQLGLPALLGLAAFAGLRRSLTPGAGGAAEARAGDAGASRDPSPLAGPDPRFGRAGLEPNPA